MEIILSFTYLKGQIHLNFNIFCHTKKELTASLFQLCLAFAFRNIKHSTILVKHDYVPKIGHTLKFNINSAIFPIVKFFIRNFSVILF